MKKIICLASMVIFLICQQALQAADITLKEFLNGFSNPFVDMSKFNAWQEEMTKRLKDAFEIAVPSSARSKWKMSGNKPLIGDTGHFATATWTNNDPATKKNEIFYLLFKNMTYEKGDKQIYSIEDCIKTIKTESIEGWEEPYKWNMRKINDQEVLLEGNFESGKDRSLRRIILKDNWLIIMKYETKYSTPESEDTWNEKKNIWQERLMKINFS